MIYFKINLIKDTLAPPVYRRVFFWIVLVYLLLCGVGLVLICFRATLNCMTLWEQRHNVEIAERVLPAELLAGGTNQPQVVALCKELDQTATTLEHIKKLMEERLFLVPVLMGVTKPLAPETRLAGMEVDRKNGAIIVELVTPDDQTNQVLQAGGLLDAWSHDPGLSEQVTNFRLSSTQHKVIGNQSFLVLKFEGVLRHKG